MEVLLAMAMLAASGCVAGGLIWYSAKVTRARREAYEAQGWIYHEQPRGFRLEGQEQDLTWQYEIKRSKGSGSKKTSAIWRTPAAPSDKILLIGPPLPAAMAAMGFGGMVVQFLAKMVLGDEAEDLVGARELRIPDALVGHFSVVGSDQELADAFLTEAVVEAMLLAEKATKKAPVLLRWKDRLEIRPTAGDFRSVETIQAVLALGVAVGPSIGYAEG